MLEDFRKHIKVCLSRADEASRVAENATGLDLKDRYSTLSSQWFLVARAYEFALNLEYGLLQSGGVWSNDTEQQWWFMKITKGDTLWQSRG